MTYAQSTTTVRDATRHALDGTGRKQHAPTPVALAVSAIVIADATQGAVDLLLQRIDTTLHNTDATYELIVVDDHLPDEVVERIKQTLQRCDVRSRLIRLRNSHGYTAALRQATAVAHHPILALFHGSSRYPPEALPTLLQRLPVADMVIADGRDDAMPTQWQTPYAASNSGKLYALAATQTPEHKPAQTPARPRGQTSASRIDTDVESGLKVLRREVFDSCGADLPDATFDLELLARCLLDGYRVVSVPVKALHANEQESVALRQDLLLQALRLRLTQATRATPTTDFERAQADTDDLDLRQITNTLTLPIPVTPTGYHNPKSLPKPVRDAITRYSQRLAADRTHARSPREQAQASYAERARQPLTLRTRVYYPFAPITRLWSAARTITIGQGVALALLAALLVASALLAPLTLAALAIAGITIFYCVDMGVMFGLAAAALTHETAQVIDDRVARGVATSLWPSYTILCPLYREVEVVPQYVEAMRLLDYPQNRLQVLLLTEQDDAETRAALLAMGLPPNFEIVVVPDGQPRTKPRACNYGLIQATGEYIVIYDAEDIPDPLQLKKAALTFANAGPELACVQAKLNFYNPTQNLLTRWFTAEYSLWFDLTLPALQRIGTFLPLGGTSNHFRTEVLRQVGGWDPFNVTEDCDLGVRLRQYDYATTMLDSTTYEEANPDLRNWLRQRSRWIKGYMQTYLVHMRQPWRYLREGRLRDFIWLQLFVGGRSATLLINPIMWLLLALYIVFRPLVAPTYAELFPRFILYIAAGSLIFGNFLFLYSHLIGCIQRKQYGLAVTTLFIPIYWALMSYASYIALYQLITKPHYWEKTQHGLHLRARKARHARSSQHPVDQPPAHPAPDPIPDEIADDEIAIEQQMTRRLASVSTTTAALPADAPAVVVAAVGSAAAVARHPLSVSAVRAQPFAANGRAEVMLSQPLADLDTARLPDIHAGTQTGSPMRRTGSPLPLSHVADMLSTTVLPTLAPPENPLRAREGAHSTTVQALAVTAPRPRQQRRRNGWGWLRDGWLLATLLTASCASLLALWYSYTSGYILLYNDSYNHLRIARRVLRSASPGIAQFGGVWLPLPHIIQLPFVWSDTLWFSGLAGSFSSMPCYVIAAVYLFLTARRLTHNGPASFIGSLALILNPNLLYLQTTPLTEPLLIATFVATGYYFVVWAQDDSTGNLILAGAAAFLATLTRYDGWPLYVACIVMIVVLGLLRRRTKMRIFGELTLFGSLGGLGIFLWFVWCQVVFGDALYFLRSPFSSAQQEQTIIGAHGMFGVHNLPQSVFIYSVAAIETLGPVIFGLGLVGALAFVLPRWRNAGALASIIFLTPYAFYILVLYLGQDSLYVPGAVPAHSSYDLFNARFGTEVIAPAALYIATLTDMLTYGVRKLGLRHHDGDLQFENAWRGADVARTMLALLLYCALAVALLAQTGLTLTGGVISLQDGQYGLSCAALLPADVFLIEHYDGGRLLDDTFHTSVHFESAHIGYNSVIYEGTGRLWSASLANPEKYVEWIVAAPHDLVEQHITLTSPAFQAHFILVAQDADGAQLYHARGLPPLPTRPLPAQLVAAHALCGASNNRPTAPPKPSIPIAAPHSYIAPTRWLTRSVAGGAA